VGEGGHRRRQGAEQRAAAGLGVRRPHRRAHAEGSWSPAQAPTCRAATLPVYQRQHFPEACWARARRAAEERHRAVPNDEIRVWTLDGEVLIASITAKLHLISPAVTEGLLKALEIAEAGYKGLVIWSPDDVFSAGANLEALMPVFMKSGAKGIAPERRSCRTRCCACATRRCRWWRHARHGAGRRLRAGGVLRRRVAAMESYIGLVEVGVGLVPGGGGLTYIARRAAEMAAAATPTPTC
jgi:3-hydroxyacyl-CoA dehydrogenase